MAGKPVHTFAAAPAAGNYGEMPVLPPDVDPQLTLSRNDRPQPFHLICEKDTVLVQMLGKGRVEFREGPARYFTLDVGDFIYVPQGMPHRILPEGVTIQYRYRARDAGREAVVWYCEGCGAEVARHVFDTKTTLLQEGYALACSWFNADAEHRTCSGCAAVHPPADTTGTRWSEIAAGIRNPDMQRSR